MRIRSLLIVGIAITFSLVLLRLAALEVHVREGERLDQFQLNVERVSRDAASLAVLSQGYILHNSITASHRWHAVHANLTRTLPSLSGYSAEFQDDVDTLTEVVQGLPVLFSAIESAQAEIDRGRAQARLEMLADHLVTETRRISDGAFELAEQMVELRRARDRETRRVTWLAMIGFGLLVLGIAAVVARRVLRPMARLQTVAQAVRSGTLGARSGYRANDEFGSLSRDFDDMICTLHERTAGLAAAMRENEALLSTIRLHAILSVADRAGTIIEANDNFCAITGYSREELIGQNHRIVNSGMQDAAFWIAMWDAIGSGKPWRGEICNRAKDGSLYWVDSIIAPFIGADGKIEKYISIRTDITAAKLSEQRLRASEAFLDRTGRVAGVGGWTIEVGSERVEWTDETCRLIERPLGYRPTLAEAYGYYAPEARPVIQQAVEAAMSAGRGWDLELPFVTATGRAIWVRVIGEVERVNGKPMRLVGAFQDVTARRGLEAALRQKAEVMASILENLPCGLSVFDSGLGLVASNREYRRLLDFPDALFETPVPHFEDFIRYNALRGEYGEGDVEAIVQKTVERARSPAVEHRFERIRPNGQPVEVRGAPMPGGGFVTTYTDVSERKRGEALLQAAHARFEIAADSAGIGVWEYDTTAGALVWDDRMYRLYGRARSADVEPYGLWASSLHRDDREYTEAALNAVLHGGGDYAAEFRIVWPDGEVRYMKANARVIRDATGAAVRMTGVNIDITERKRAELDLLSATSLLRTVLDSASEVSIIATDPQLNITVFNAGAEQLLGYASEEMVGRMTPIVIHDLSEIQARGRELSTRLGRTVEGGAVFTEPTTLHEPREWTYLRKDGGRVTVSLVVTAMQGADGKVFGYLGIAHDVTRQKAYEESLHKAMHSARRANLAKSQFLANMSHEIRTPMNAVIGLSYLLAQTALDDRQSDYLAKISLASQSLLALINDILDLSKVEAGELAIECAPFALDHLLKNLADIVGVQASAKGIGFVIDAPSSLPAVLEGDSSRLNQILTNLLANAIKFTDTGGVKLVVSKLGDDSRGVRLRFAVQDSGIGIAPGVQGKLFAPFTQADASMTRRFGGTGLGLSIVRHLTNLMGGEVSLTSTLGVGSEFVVVLTFPRAAPEALAGQSRSPAGQNAIVGVRVLVVDDNDVNLEVARRILELQGAQVTLARNGHEACDVLRATPQAFDLVLMDVQMPVVDGYEATRCIRTELGLKVLPVLALTAGALTSERQLAADAGMDDFISKPFDPHALVASVERYAWRGRSLPDASVPATPPGLPLNPAAWPVIPGIDTADAQQRFGGDAALFRSLLGRLMGEFGDLACIPALKPTQGLNLEAATMHKLKGGAGTLGMTEVHRIAGEAETACRTGDIGRAEQLAGDLAAQLQLVREGAATFLAERMEGIDDPSAPGAGEPTDVEALTELGNLLRERNLSAIDHLSKASTQLRRLLGKPTYEAVCKLIVQLQFEEARQVLADEIQSDGF
jgi:PAS domain S-box-containing protein